MSSLLWLLFLRKQKHRRVIEGFTLYALALTVISYLPRLIAHSSEEFSSTVASFVKFASKIQ